VRALTPGDNVTGDCSIYCGECEFCEHDRNLCRSIEKFGITLDGASRQFFLQDERYLYAAPAGADLDLVALSEPLAVGARAVERVAGSRPGMPGEKVLVMGGGAIGLACLIALKYTHGCERVELFDLLPGRVQLARSLGAAPPGDVSDDGSAGDTYGSLYSGNGYDVVFETTGVPAVFRQAVDLLRPRGTIMALGFIPSVEFRMKTITLKAASIMGSMGGTGQFPVALDFVARHPAMAQALIAHRIPFGRVDRAFELALGRECAPKVLVSFAEETGETR
jgi:threonine dehydrogenase-like Zn-dependent dehydrogenase